MEQYTPYVVMVLGALIAVLGFLLSQKDAKQGREIDLLWTKHDEDATALQELRIQIASQHYVKSELDPKFVKLEETTSEGFKTMGTKFDNLATALLTRITSGAPL